MSLIKHFCDVDDLCLAFEQWVASRELGQTGRRPGPKPRFCASEIMTINDQLKNISQIAYTLHRSVQNFLVNLIAGLIAYTHQEKKPSLNLSTSEQALLPAAFLFRTEVMLLNPKIYPIYV